MAYLKRTGEKNRRITLQRQVQTQAADGTITLTWHEVAKIWAAVEPLNGRELFQAQQTKPEVTHRVVIQPWSGVSITSRDRLLVRSRTFGIESIINLDERDRELVMLCREEA